MPSMVVIAPSAWTASTVQLLTASPSRWRRAGAARRRVAPDVRAGQAEVLADVVHEQRARLDVMGVRDPIDGDADFHGLGEQLAGAVVAELDRRRDAGVETFDRVVLELQVELELLGDRLADAKREVALVVRESRRGTGSDR
jgi:hypothetical protein